MGLFYVDGLIKSFIMGMQKSIIIAITITTLEILIDLSEFASNTAAINAMVAKLKSNLGTFKKFHTNTEILYRKAVGQGLRKIITHLIATPGIIFSVWSWYYSFGLTYKDDTTILLISLTYLWIIMLCVVLLIFFGFTTLKDIEWKSELETKCSHGLDEPMTGE